jgi:hypothetical protein
MGLRRALVATSILWLLASPACGDDATTPTPDAGPPERDAAMSGDTGPTTPCGPVVCRGGEFCLVEPTGPCEARDGGACGPNEESCEHEGVIGCTTPRDRSCPEIPAACQASASCVCFIASNPCTGPNPECSRAMGAGFQVECPF